MNKDEYDKVFQHINDLAQKHALGKIGHETMYDGLKKLLEELMAETAARSAQAGRRRAFWRGCLIGAGLLAALAYGAFVLSQMGWLGERMKGNGAPKTSTGKKGHVK